MQKEKKDKHFIHKPEFIGGEKARKQYVQDHLRYPEDALKNNIQGAVHLHYVIDYQGKIKNVKVISGIGFGCDEEAIRVVQGFKYKVPRKHNMQMEFNKNVHIHFKINRPESPVKIDAVPPLVMEDPAQSTSYQIVYHTPDEKKDAPPNSYTYSVNL